MASSPLVPLYQPLPRSINNSSGSNKRGAGPPTAESFFSLAVSMMEPFRDFLLHPERLKNNGGNNNSNSSAFDRVTAYAMLNEVGYSGQVQALALLKGWFTELLRTELVEGILGDVPAATAAANNNNNGDGTTAALPGVKQTIKKIAVFLAAYAKLVAFARSCYLALESPQFLGKFLATNSNSSTNNLSARPLAVSSTVAGGAAASGSVNSSATSSPAMKRRFGPGGAASSLHVSSSTSLSSSEAFIPSLLRGMLREVAAERLRPYLLKHIPRVLHQVRVEHIRAHAKLRGGGIGDDALADAVQQVLESVSRQSGNNTAGTGGSGAESGGGSADAELALLAYVVAFFRNVVGGSSSSGGSGSADVLPSSDAVGGASTSTTTTTSTLRTGRERHDEYVFRVEFFDRYLRDLAAQYAAMATHLVATRSVDRDWGSRAFRFVDTLLGCERGISAALFPGAASLQAECLKTVSAAFIKECAAPLIHDERNGVGALLKRGAVLEAARLITLVAAEAAAVPALQRAVEESMRARLRGLFDAFETDIDALVESAQQKTTTTASTADSSSSAATGGGAATMSATDIVQSAQNRRLRVICELANDIQQWNTVVHHSPSAMRMVLERVRRAVFREGLDGKALRGVAAGLRVTQAHIADVLAQYCDQLMRDNLKGDDMLPVYAPISSSSSSSSSSAVDRTGGGGGGTSGGSVAAAISSGHLDAMVFVFDLLAQLLSYLKDKDVAIELHRIRTAKRLLERKANLDLECVLAHKLSHVVELSQTRKFEGMFADVERWPDDLAAFKNFCAVEEQVLQQQSGQAGAAAAAATATVAAASALIAGVEFAPSVLTSSKWPAFRTRTSYCFAAVPVLQHSIERFERFYHRQTQHARKLLWVVEHSTAVVQVQFPRGPKEVSGSLAQMMVLIVVDELAPKKRCAPQATTEQQQQQQFGVTLDEITKYCCTNPLTPDRVPQDLDPQTVLDIRASLASLLLNSKFPVLRSVKASASSSVPQDLDSVRVELNHDFSLRIRKFTVPKAGIVAPAGSGGGGGKNSKGAAPVAAADGSGGMEDGSIPPEIIAQRSQVLDANIVRLMKSRQRLPLSEIVNHVAFAVKLFATNYKMVKRQVETLMDRGFLKRLDNDDDDPAANKGAAGEIFEYVA